MKKSLVSIAAVVVLGMGGALVAQTPYARVQPMHTGGDLGADFFPFYIAWNDSVAGTATDLSFLNDKPAGVNGRVIVRDGHLVESSTGNRIRFFGTNVCADEAFPKSKQDADAFAAALAKRGINMVRMHHLENPWAVASGGSIWSPIQTDRQIPDPAQLDKLDYLIAQFIKNGIFVNLNLKVSKTLTAADGMDPSVKDVPFPFQKRLDYFEPRAIELQKDYAKRLLTHVNPYLGKRYVDEPGVAIVEVNNENCLLTLWPGQEFGNDLDKMPAPFFKQLTARWNDWLAKAARTDAELTERWNKGIEALGASAIPDGLRWTHEMQGDAKCEVVADKAHTPGSVPAVTIQVDARGGPDWHAQVHLVNLDLRDGAQYTLEFEARSPADRSTRVAATVDIDPWSNVGLDQSFVTNGDWQTFTMPFAASAPVAQHTRIAFSVGGSSTPLELRNIKLRTGSPRFELAKGASLTTKSIPIPFKPTVNQRRDYVDFMVSVEHEYADAMRDYLRNDLGVKSLVYVSQAQWGGLAGVSREARSDVIDTHDYSEHPQFAAGADWDIKRWTIAQKSQIRAYAATGRFSLSGPAEYRVAGKPFSISEYDQAAPNDYAAETLPLLAAIGAAQDWDAIYTFAQGTYGSNAKPDRITGFFDHTNHPAKVALNPFAAILFRTGALEPIRRVSTLTVGSDAYQQHAYPDAAWRAAKNEASANSILSTRLQIEQVSQSRPPVIGTRGAEDSALRFIKNPAGGALVIDSPSAVGLVGFIGGSKSNAGAMEADVKASGENFAVITAHAVDGKSIASSTRVLLTAIVRAENPNMGWNETRTSVADQWGDGPVQCKGVDAAIRLRRDAACKVYALDTTGKRAHEVPVQHADGMVSFRISPEWKTVWYEIAAP